MEITQQSVQDNFMAPWQMDLIRCGSDPLLLLPELVQAAGLVPPDRLDAV